MVSVVRFFCPLIKMEHFKQKNITKFSLIAHYIQGLNGV